MENCMGIVDGSLRQPPVVHLKIDELEIERRETAEFALSKRRANI
jgi:hypothetical protein